MSKIAPSQMGFTSSQVKSNPRINEMNSLEPNKRLNDYLASFIFKEAKEEVDRNTRVRESWYGIRQDVKESNNPIIIGNGRPRHTGVGIYKKK